MKAMSWSLPLNEQQLDALVHDGLGMDEASREMGEANGKNLPADMASRLLSIFSESHEIFRFINDQCLAVTGSPHAVSMYNIACLISLVVELQLRFLDPKANDDLLAAAQKYENASVTQLQDLPSGGVRMIGSYESVIGNMIFKQLTAAKACLGGSVAAGWSHMDHLKQDSDLTALRVLLPQEFKRVASQ